MTRPISPELEQVLERLAAEFMNDPQGLEDKIGDYLRRAALLASSESGQPNPKHATAMLPCQKCGGNVEGPRYCCAAINPLCTHHKGTGGNVVEHLVFRCVTCGYERVEQVAAPPSPGASESGQPEMLPLRQSIRENIGPLAEAVLMGPAVQGTYSGGAR